MPAVAQITAAEYWAHLQATTGATGRAEPQAKGLRVQDVVVQGGGVRIEAPVLLLTETAKGLELRGPDGALVELDEWMFDGASYTRAAFRVDMPDQVSTITGDDVTALRYDFSTPKMVMALTELAGAPVAGDSFVLSISNATGHFAPQAGTDEFAANLDQVEVAQSATTGPSTHNFRLMLSDLALEAQYNIPQAAMPSGQTAAEAIAAGLVMDMSFSAAGGQASFAEETPVETTIATVGLGAVGFELGMGPKGFSLDQSAKGLSLALDHQTEDPEQDPVMIAVGGADYQVQMAAPLEALDELERQDGSFPPGVSMGVDLALRDLLLSVGPKETPLADFEIKTSGAKLAIDDTALDMSAQLAGAAFQGNMGDLGETVALQAAEAGFSLLFPVNTVDEPAPFQIGYKTVGLTLSDPIWDLLDAAKLFPRDPINIDFAMDNIITLRAPLAELDRYDVDKGDMPVELNAVKLTTLLLSGLGVKVTGTGAADLDYSEVMTTSDIPKGDGKFSFDLLGINGLFDKLEQGGFLSSDELMGARMGLMMFAKSAGEGDHMTSEVELREGRVYLNGMLMR
ncbi:hypothetical protein [Neogemmobacter tilapiae]|nr:hypothetical protein [Gemmobacter tilapiae]